MISKIIISILVILVLFSCGQKSSNSNKEPNKNNKTAEYKPQNEIVNKEVEIIDYSIELGKYVNYKKNIITANQDSYNIKIITDFEKERDTVEIAKFIYNNYFNIFDLEDSLFSQSYLMEYIYLIDINNDGKKDAFYHGPTGGMNNMTKIFLNCGNDYKEVFKQFQNIFEIEFKDNKLSKIALTNPGCCADPQVVDYFYSVTFEKDIPKFELIQTIGYLNGYEKLKNEYHKEKTFSIIKDGSKLRNECYEFDLHHAYYGDEGNVLTHYNKGSNGKAFGEKTENGIVWLFVLMENKNKFEENDFPIFKEQPTKLYGWIKKSETDLK